MSSSHLQFTLQRIQEIQSRFESIAPRAVETPDAGLDFGAYLEQAQGMGDENIPQESGLMAMIQDKAMQQGVDPALIKAIVKNESGFNPKAVSPVGAQGLMQLMPGTAKSLGVENSFNAEENLEGGTKYLKGLIQKFQSVPLGVAAYNAGPGAVQKYGGVPPYAETTNYVKKVMNSYAAYKNGGAD